MVEAIFAVSAMQRPHLTESSYVNALRMRSCSTLGGCHAASVLKPVSADFEAQCNMGELFRQSADVLIIRQSAAMLTIRQSADMLP